MKFIRKILTVILIILIANFPVVLILVRAKLIFPMILVGGGFYFIYSIFPGRISGVVSKQMSIPIQILYGGCELVSVAVVCSVVSIAINVWAFFYVAMELTFFNVLFGIGVLALMIMQGMTRIIVFSKQVSVMKKILILFLCWVPIVNIIFVRQMCKKARLECEVETHIRTLDAAREENQICRTKYPVFMVHGIFFRDWQYFNYWGRVPVELVRNGAVVHYGNQQSSLSVLESAQELSEQIRQIVNDTGCEKVNIIAHSKGGLDSRYAISCLGCAPFVASLTTINTPHMGCVWVDHVLTKVPKAILKHVEKRYNQVFQKLGDKQPDFLGGIRDLTVESATLFNQNVPNKEGILYQSVMSQMRKPGSGKFPLNMSYRVIRKVQGSANDGLVPVESARWGRDLGILRASGKRGISHGDMIDLNRENIPGFNVREFYVSVIAGLKQNGL